MAVRAFVRPQRPLQGMAPEARDEIRPCTPLVGGPAGAAREKDREK